MNCKDCGKKVENGTKKCPYCGGTSFVDNSKLKKVLSITLGAIIVIIILSVIISKNSLSSDERKIYKFIKDNGYGYTGGGTIEYGFTVISKDNKMIGCFNIELEKIDCKRMNMSKYDDYTTKIDERKINKKLGQKYD